MLTQQESIQEYKELLLKAPIYEKCVYLQAYHPIIRSQVATILPSGRLEGMSIAVPNEHYAVINPGGEQYVVKKEEFLSNYIHKSGYDYAPKGTVHAVQYHGKQQRFEANWGYGTIYPGDWLVCREKFNGIWHVGEKEFAQTYKLKD